MRCYRCGSENLEPHAAFPQIKVFIDRNTGMIHKCNPQNTIIQEGKWKGYTYQQMAAIWWDRKQADKKRLAEIREQSKADG